MPKPAGSGQRYVPGLDGLRAIAVLAVIAYHIGLGWAPGGLLGVGVFFTLSGYLITDLLLGQRKSSGSLELLEFWRRRARRLLPALFVMLVVVVCWVALLQSAQLPALRGATAAAAGYVSNWWLIAQNSSYFARFGPPSPLGHLWSLAVEEQFYLIWPWLLVLGLRVTRGRSPQARRYLLIAGTLTLAAASIATMVALYHPGYDPTRVYDGTDTRAFALLIGAALAIACPSRQMPADPSHRRRVISDATGAAGLVVIGLLIWRTGQYSPFLYRGGMVALSVATAAVVWAVVLPASRLGELLGSQPLRWLGVRSYGIYLWHFPIIVLTTPATGTSSFARSAGQVGASVAVAALSWHFVEQPIRRGAISRWWSLLRSGSWRSTARRGWAMLAAAAGITAVAGVALAGAVPAASAGQAKAPVLATGSSAVSSLAGPGSPAGPTAAGHGALAAGLSQAGASGPSSGPLPHTSCRSVVHIGDSTSDGLISSDYLPDPQQRITAQYAMVGIKKSIMEISGGRSVVETLPGQQNAYTVARQLISHGYRGCWVLALGTNDTADVYVGSNVGVAARIQRMMSVIGEQPVLWVNVKSLLSTGPYSERDMQAWNHALMQACSSYPNMRVFNWAALARPAWFISDGIHYTSPGYAARSHLIATALAQAFPQNPPPPPPPRLVGGGADDNASCLVD
jgi:peptidoglycan/LPS O-acetylase OafA/YrhL